MTQNDPFANSCLGKQDAGKMTDANNTMLFFACIGQIRDPELPTQGVQRVNGLILCSLN